MKAPILLAGADLLLGTLVVAAWLRPATDAPPRVIVDPPRRTLVVTPGSGNQTLTFRVRNAGARALTVGKFSSSCGCTGVRIDRATIPGRGAATLTVTVQPASIGERHIEVHFPTNDPLRPTASLAIDVSVNTPLPFVVSAPPNISFGPLTATAHEANFTVTTEERYGEPPWLTRIASDAEGLDCALKLSRESPIGHRAIIREYAIRATWQRRPEVGSHVGVFRLDCASGNLGHVEVPFSAERLPTVYTTPRAIHAGEPGSYRLLVQSREWDRSTALILPTSLPSFLHLRQVEGVPTRPPVLGIVELSIDEDAARHERVDYRANLGIIVRNDLGEEARADVPVTVRLTGTEVECAQHSTAVAARGRIGYNPKETTLSGTPS
jgi:hypothetical protein